MTTFDKNVVDGTLLHDRLNCAYLEAWLEVCRVLPPWVPHVPGSCYSEHCCSSRQTIRCVTSNQCAVHPPILKILASGGHRKRQKTADFRRKPFRRKLKLGDLPCDSCRSPRNWDCPPSPNVLDFACSRQIWQCSRKCARKCAWSVSRAAKRVGFKRGGFPIWTCPSFSFLFCPLWDFPDFSGIFRICSGTLRGFSRFVLFLFLGLLRAPTRNSPERVRDTIWTFPEKSGKPPGLETPRFSFSQQFSLESKQKGPAEQVAPRVSSLRIHRF